MNSKLSYILNLRNSLKKELRNMPLFQNGSALIVENEKKEILLQYKKNQQIWALPGGLQELGETFEEVAIRELEEETGLIGKIEDLILIHVISGKTRKNKYPNGDEVYNNTVLWLIKKYEGDLKIGNKELTDYGNGNMVLEVETLDLKFYSIDHLPKNLMDQDCIQKYLEYRKNNN